MFIIVPLFVAWIVWYLVHDIERYWLRCLVRAGVLALAVTWNWVPVAHGGHAPLPAFLILSSALHDNSMNALRYGGVPLLIVRAVFWLFGMVVGILRGEISMRRG